MAENTDWSPLELYELLDRCREGARRELELMTLEAMWQAGAEDGD